jgi:hypothetical protein
VMEGYLGWLSWQLSENQLHFGHLKNQQDTGYAIEYVECIDGWWCIV